MIPEISLKNDAIKARNAEKQLIRGLEQEIILTERSLSRLVLERKELPPIKPLEQQPQTKKATETDARNAITKYKTAIDEIANQIFL